MADLFEIAGEEYYFDLERICDYIKLERKESLDEILKIEKESVEEDSEEELDDHEESYTQMIDITKWELTKAMIECVLSENGIIDEDMGINSLSKQLSIPFRISFNTLSINKIIKKN